MKSAKRTTPFGLLLGLCLTSVVCQANALSQPTVHEADSAESYSAAALYNLGNSYAKQGRIALAVLNYERAQLLAPHDPDIRANLQHELEAASLPAVPTRLADHLRVLSPNAAYWLGLIGLVIAGASGLLLSLKKSPRSILGAALGGGLLMMSVTLADAASTAGRMREAVVMQSTSASASPISDVAGLFTLTPATIVHIQDEHGNFMLVRDSQGNVGWVPRGQLAAVVNDRKNFHA